MLELKRLTCFDGAPPDIDHARDVVRMEGVARRPPLQFLGSLSEILQGLAVEKLDLARRTMGRHKPGNAVEDQAQALFVRLEGFLSALPVVNVGQQHVPTGETTFCVPRGERARLEPPVHTIGTPLAELNSIRLAGFDRVRPRVNDARKIIRMNGVAGRPVLQVLRRLAEIFQGLPVEQLDLACRVERTHEPRNALDDQPKAFLTLGEQDFRSLSVFDVGVRAEPFNDASLVVERRSRTEQKPAIRAIGAPQTCLNLAWLAGSQNGSP